MKLLLYLKFLMITISESFIKIRRRVNYTIQNPTCRFYNGSILIDSSLEGFNIMFNNVYIFASNIGKHTYVQKNTTIINTDVGKFCSIASNVSIGPGIHKLDAVSTHPSFYLKNTPLIKSFSDKDYFESSKKTIIGHDVWIGEGVIIIDGITIGTGAVIAAGSVVTKEVPPYAIVGGVPAKVIKYRFNQTEISLLLNSKWWNLSEEWFEKNYKNLDSINTFSKTII